MSGLRAYWMGQAEWWGSRSLDWWAAHLTALYIGGSLTIMGARFDELIILKLNEMGDLAAGVFGPVAFLWLVLGYVQQGRELKLSSDALRLQAEELKASVEQQTAMVDVSRRQLEAEMAAATHQLQRSERDAEPDVRFRYDETVFLGAKECARIYVSNRGAKCEFLRVTLYPLFEDDSCKPVGVGLLSADDFSSSELGFHIPFELLSVYESAELCVTCVKLTGSDSIQYFSVRVVELEGMKRYATVSRLIKMV